MPRWFKGLLAGVGVDADAHPLHFHLRRAKQNMKKKWAKSHGISESHSLNIIYSEDLSSFSTKMMAVPFHTTFDSDASILAPLLRFLSEAQRLKEKGAGSVDERRID